MKFEKEKVLPLSLTAFVVLLDQITKAIIAIKWPIPEGSWSRLIWPNPEGSHPREILDNAFLCILHVRNKAIAFSLGENLPEPVKKVAFIILPILVLGFLLWYFFRSNEFTKIQRWAAAGIIGGGLGNIIDRIFRPDGVVDFISINFYGILGMQRWPTFNVADSSVVVCCLLLFISIFFEKNKKNEVLTNE